MIALAETTLLGTDRCYTPDLDGSALFRRGVISVAQKSIREEFNILTSTQEPFILEITCPDNKPQVGVHFPDKRSSILVTEDGVTVTVPSVSSDVEEEEPPDIVTAYEWSDPKLSNPLKIGDDKTYDILVSKVSADHHNGDDGADKINMKITGKDVFYSVEFVKDGQKVTAQKPAEINVSVTLNAERIKRVIASAEKPDDVLRITAQPIAPPFTVAL